MRYDRELQAAGKFFVAAIQGENGLRGRDLMKKLKLNGDLSLCLRVEMRDGNLHAMVGTYEWLATDDFPTFEVIEHLPLE